MGFGTNMFDGEGAYTQMIAKVQDIKAAPQHGQKRLVVKEHGKLHQQAVIDIDMAAMAGLEEDGTYIFQVKEKDDSRYGYQRKKSTSFKSYSCDGTPEAMSAGSIAQALQARFGGEKGGRTHKRTKF